MCLRFDTYSKFLREHYTALVSTGYGGERYGEEAYSEVSGAAWVCGCCCCCVRYSLKVVRRGEEGIYRYQSRVESKDGFIKSISGNLRAR
jgi:hypothetical protein